MKKTTLFLLISVIIQAPGYAQIVPLDAGTVKQSFTYAIKGSDTLRLDVLRKASDDSVRTCVLFIFGGAFMAGHRDDSIYNHYFNTLVANNYTVISMSYRLGLKNVGHLSKFNIAPLRKAVDMAVEDTYDATAWVIDHAALLKVDTSQIVLSGSSSGAITTLVAEFSRSNHLALSGRLPPSFRYAGTITFSGAVLSFSGKLRYKERPAPALLFHGTADKIVPYRKIRFLNKGFYGSSWIAGTYKKAGYPYFIYRADNLGHEVAVRPMYEQTQLILDFLEKYVREKQSLQVDMEVDDPAIKPLMTLTPGQLFKKLEANH